MATDTATVRSAVVVVGVRWFFASAKDFTDLLDHVVSEFALERAPKDQHFKYLQAIDELLRQIAGSFRKEVFDGTMHSPEMRRFARTVWDAEAELKRQQESLSALGQDSSVRDHQEKYRVAKDALRPINEKLRNAFLDLVSKVC